MGSGGAAPSGARGGAPHSTAVDLREEIDNLIEYIHFRLAFPRWDGSISEDEDPDAFMAQFGPASPPDLWPANQLAWELAEAVRYLGGDLAARLEPPLLLDPDEALALRRKLTLVAQYHEALDQRGEARVLTALFGRGK